MYFDNCKTADEARKIYYKLAMTMHPDKGGKTADFQNLNEEYKLFLERKQGKATGNINYQEDLEKMFNWFKQNYPDEYNSILAMVGEKSPILKSILNIFTKL